jgi:hypothetical protein
VAITQRLCAREPVERARLRLAEGVLPVHREDAAERGAELVLDLLVQFVERNAQPLREPGAQRGLARAAQAHQRNATRTLAARLAEALLQLQRRLVALLGTQAAQQLERRDDLRIEGPIADQLLQRAAERLGDAPDQQDRDVSVTRLELREVAFGESRQLRQALSRQVRFVTTFAHAATERLEECVLVFRLAARHGDHATSSVGQ